MSIIMKDFQVAQPGTRDRTVSLIRMPFHPREYRIGYRLRYKASGLPVFLDGSHTDRRSRAPLFQRPYLPVLIAAIQGHHPHHPNNKEDDLSHTLFHPFSGCKDNKILRKNKENLVRTIILPCTLCRDGLSRDNQSYAVSALLPGAVSYNRRTSSSSKNRNRGFP